MTYRYLLGADISMEDVNESLMLAILAMECLHGAARARLELSHKFDPTKRICTIDATTDIGRELNCLFAGLLMREFGSTKFTVTREPRRATW